MKVFLTGAASPLGIRTVQLLQAHGHQVTISASGNRSTDGAAGRGATIVPADNPRELAEALQNQDALANLQPTVHPPGTGLDILTRHSTVATRRQLDNLHHAVMLSGVPRWIQRSTVSAYPDSGQRWISDSLDYAPHPRLRTTVHAEETATSAPITTIVLRLAHLVGADDPPTQQWIAAARNGYQLLDLPNETYWPTLHLDDAATAIQAALTAPGGTYNVADLNILRFDDITDMLARAVGRSTLYPLGASMSPRTWRLYARSHRVDSNKINQLTGWIPRSGPFPLCVHDIARRPDDTRGGSFRRVTVPW